MPRWNSTNRTNDLWISPFYFRYSGPQATLNVLKPIVRRREPRRGAFGVVEQTGDLRVNAALSILSEKFTDPALSLTKLSEALGVGEDHFGRLFKKEVRSPFRHYLRQLRIEQAKHLLLNSTDGIKAIAGAVGYSSHSYFTHDFREHVGMQPRKFREAVKAAEPCGGISRKSDL